MNTADYVINIILFIGTAQGLVLSAVLFTVKRGNRYANRILGLNILVFSLIIALFLIRTQDSDLFCFSCLIVQILFFLLGPLIYFYIRSLTNKNYRVNWRSIYHLTVFGLVICCYLVYFHSFTDSGLVLRDRIDAFRLIAPILSRILAFHMLGYLIYSFSLLKEHAVQIRQTHSSLGKINLNWLKFLLGGYMVIWISAIYFDILGSGCGYNAWSFLSILFSILMYLMGYIGLRQPEIFTGIETSPFNGPNGTTDSHKYKKSALTSELIQEYAQRVDTVMKEQKPYLESDLTLSRLASIVSISPHHLSQVINEYYKQNFFEYVNSQRIKDAEQLLVSPEFKNQNITSICYEVGFNSISVFNSAFKKLVGKTPSLYRKEHS